MEHENKVNTLLGTILGRIPDLGKWQRDFMLHLIPLFLSIKGRLNFMQLHRYGGRAESTYRSNFGKVFPFLSLSTELVKEVGSGYYIAVFDPSHIKKSGKHTEGKDNYWSGCDGRVVPGLEIGGLGLVDVEHHTALHLEAVQTPSVEELKRKGLTRTDYYADIIVGRHNTIEQFTSFLAVDSAFSGIKFIDEVVGGTNLAVISRLRKNAYLRYLYKGPRTGKRGRPKMYDGKIDVANPDMRHFEVAHRDSEMIIYSAVVNVRSLKRNVKLGLVHYLDEGGNVKRIVLYFCTNPSISAWMLVKYYRLRYQEEFLFRDGNQFTGLETCQARSKEKLHFHFNTSLFSVSIAKAVAWIAKPKEERKSFSMADVKTIMHNQLLLEKFFSTLEIDPKSYKNNPKLLELYKFGTIAA